jgi:hypothetical protein
MSAPTAADQNAVPSDANGGPLAYHFQQIQAQHDRLIQTVRELQEKVAALEVERDRLRDESEMYRKSLQYMLGKYEPFEFTMTPEEFEELKKTGVPLSEVIKEVEAG